MNDNQTTITDLKNIVAQFVQERDWNQFHDPKNCVMNLSVEVAELMERFIWPSSSDSYKTLETYREHIEQEVSDTLLALLAFANACNIDIAKAFESKMKLNRAKYPVEKAKGRYDKYTKI